MRAEQLSMRARSEWSLDGEVSLNNHCHAPTCLSVRIYACAKGVPLAACSTANGELICRPDPIQGGTDHPDIAGTPCDEPGSHATPARARGGKELWCRVPKISENRYCFSKICF